jgi:phage shock protein E
MRTWMALVATLILVGCAANERAKPDPAPPTAARPLIIDVRSQAEWDAGHLDGAVLIPHTEIAGRIGEVAPDKARPIALYCRSARRAGLAKDVLDGMGYTRVENVGSLDDARKRFAPR